MIRLLDERLVAAALAEPVTLVIALVTAEMFFKFHSFTLELLAFAALWRGMAFLERVATNAARKRTKKR